MDQSDFAQINQFLLELYQDARELAPEEFQHTTLKRLHEFIPYDYAAWGGGLKEARQITELFVLNQDREMLLQWQEIGHQDAFCDITMQRLNRTCLFDDVDDYRNSFAYNEHWREFDVRQMMSTMMNEPLDGFISFIGLCCEDGARRFNERERETKQLLMPHLSSALHLNRETALGQMGHTDEGYALINQEGWLLSCTSAFRQLLREELGQRHLTRLPRETVSQIQDNRFWRGRAIRLQHQPTGPYLMLRARPLTAVEKLSPRAQEVAELYAAGLSHKAVALRLGISPETVRKHLARIYQQLGINSKAALANIIAPSVTTG